MKLKLILIAVLIIPRIVSAQMDFSAGMGLNMVNSASLRDYVNANYAPRNEQMPSFNSAIEFFVEADYSLSKNYQIGFEYAYSIFSYNSPFGSLGIYDITCDLHKPSAVLYYVIPGIGYKLKFGGGVGYRYISVDEKLFNASNSNNYSSGGLGILMKVQGLTSLGGNFYANIGFDIRFDFPGEPESGSLGKINKINNDPVNFNSISAGIKLGVSYVIGEGI